MRGANGIAALAAGALAACAGGKLSHDAAPAASDAAAAADAGTSAQSFTVETTNELAADLPTLDDATIEAWGAVAPVGWYTGGLLAHASDTGTFTDAASATWADVQAMPATGVAAIEWSTDQIWSGPIPPGVGLTDPNDFTLWAEGELYLDVGTWTFSLYADDHGFVELAQPGSTEFTRVVSADYPSTITGTYTANAAGWYPFRYAFSNHQGGTGIDLMMSGPTVPATPIPRERVRARVDDIAGLAEAAFDDGHDVGPVATTIDSAAPANIDWMTTTPPDLGLSSDTTFSVRWTGQLRVDVAGEYQLRYQTDDGQRLWLDGTEVLDAWLDTVQDETTSPITLDAGWHDLVVDESQNTGDAAAHLTVAAGPDLIGMPLPVDRLRPVEARSERITPGTNATHVAIPDNTTVESDITLTAPDGAAVSIVDVTYEITHGDWGDLVVSLRAPDGSTAVLRNRADEGTSGDRVERFVITALTGTRAAGTWSLFVQDAATGNTGTLEDFEVTPHYAGGSPPIPAMAAAESVTHDLGPNVTSIDKISWNGRTPIGAGVAVRVRTCDDAASCAQAAWSAPVTSSGDAPVVAPARWLQYRIELSSDGDHAADVESIRVDYSTSAAD